MSEIDISECKDNFGKISYINTKDGDCQIYHFRKFCKDIPVKDCYYKQLQYWKHQAELGSETTNRLSEQLGKLQQENEEIKIEINNIQKSNGFWGRTCARQERKLKKIEEIANVIIDGNHITNDIEGHLKELTKIILQIIEE